MNTKARTKKPLKLDKKSYILFAIIGILLIAVILLVQTRFKKDMRLSDNGFAIVSGTVTDSLNADPNDNEAGISETVSMYEFKALDYFYTQSKYYYLGEEKKTQIDTSYPIYMKNGNVLQLLNSNSVLFDEDYEQVTTYKGLYLQGGHTFNVNGEQADPMKFLFLELNNGNFINLAEIIYEEKDREFDINENSIVHFENDYFSYYEYEDGALLYKYRISVTDETILVVDGVSHTYDELLKLLKLRSDLPQFDNNELPTEPSTEEVETETETEENVEKETETGKEEETKTPEENSTEADEEEETTGESNDDDKVSPGVRPDTMRPDKDNNSGDDYKEPIQEYVKPIVNIIKPFEGRVYRFVGEIEVIDPAKRIDSKKLVQFEVYSTDKKGNRTLVTRSYCSGSGEVVIGGGSIKPNSEYIIVGFFTYNNEYNESIVEQLGEWKVSTKSIDTLGSIDLLHEQKNTYSDRIEIENVSYADSSDEEAVYGINTTGGIVMVVKNESGTKEITRKNLVSSDITNFKRNARLVVSTLSVLEAKTTYKYEFVVKDYFGNDLKLTNEAGFAITCNNTPKASLRVETNEIANVQINVNVVDVDAAVIPGLNSTTECDVYLVLSKDAYGVETLQDEKVITYYKLQSNEYEYTDENGLKVDNLLVTFDSLDLDEGMYASVYCDYDLDNGAGEQRFKNIGQIKFTTTGLASLGRIYVDVEFDEENLTHNSLPISYTLNDKSTNPELSKLIVGFETDVVGGTGDDKIVYNTLGFQKTNINNNIEYIYQKFRDGETVTYKAHDLESMTTYNLEPRVYLEYNGKIYDNVSVVLSQKSFKTLRKPAEVIVDDLLFAAGTLVFDVTVNDPDESIIGASGDKVVINLYTTSGEFVKATRVVKNQSKPETITFTNLDVDRKYEIRFLAVEYNEGYSNSTYISNHILKTVNVTTSVRLDGTIKLQEINEIYDNNEQYNAVVKATLNDEDHYLSGDNAIPYYISVEKNNVPVMTYEYWKNTEPVAKQYITNYQYPVDIGENKYTLTLYVIISGRTMILDTLEFTTETTVKGFSNAFEMISYISENPNGKFVATNSFVLNGNKWNFPGIVDPGDVENLTEEELQNAGIVLEQGLSGTAITSIFDGKIDFQGFTLTHKYYADGQKIFTNIGANGEIKNIVYKIYLLNDGYIYDEGILCYRNYGLLSDFYLDYAGATNILDNRTFGLICRVNCSTGIIENFVVKNKPEENLNGFTAYQYAGMVAYENYGIIRYGYVYGDNIIATNVVSNIDRRIAGIVGTNQGIGKVYSVYSLLNVDQALRDNTQKLTYGYRYGAVCGYSSGVLSNLYSASESMYKENKNDTVNYYQKTPVVGDSANRNSNVYFYSPSGFDYIYAVPSAIKGVSEMSLNNLYDAGWQTSMLTNNFDTSLVEVGYYPHVKLSEDLPEQEYIPLPSRVMSGEVDVSRAAVLEYLTLNEGEENETQAALVEFVFSNRDGLDISFVEIDGLTVELDLNNAKTEDGYTTIKGLVYNPQTFNSEYLIRKVGYYRNNALKENTTDFTLLADFYRNIYTVDDWYNYVVLKAKNTACENVRLMNDLDFTDVNADRIIVGATFTAKIDGNDKYMRNINLQNGFKSTATYAVRNLFSASPSIDYSGEVKDLYIDNYYAGGTYITNNKTYVARYGSVFRVVKGTIDGVHLSNANIVSYEQVGGIVAYADVGAEIKNCTVTGLDITYLEPDNQNIDASVGGVVGYITNGRITHCLATGINITAEEMKGSNGFGGVIGYAVNTAIDTAYAEGEIETRASKVGGVIGEYYSTSTAVACVKNILAKVDIISHTDSVGGLIGQINITQERISERNNFSGIAFGDVYVSNPNSENITHTIGSNIGKNIKFYGTNEQLVNGMTGKEKEDDDNEKAYDETVVLGLLEYEALRDDKAIDTYINVIGFDNVYDYSYAKEGFLPKMYDAELETLLPNQPNIPLDDSESYNIEVSNVFTNNDTRIITVELWNPDNYKITHVNIEKLKRYYVNVATNPIVQVTIDEASDYSEGYTRIYIQYDTNLGDDDYYLDSYVMNCIEFFNVKGSNELSMDEVTAQVNAKKGEIVQLKTFSRVGATLYMDIATKEEWNHIAVREKNGHIYENYRIISDIDFTSYQVANNLRIGRLSGVNGAGTTISNIRLEGTGKNLISRLNSGIYDLTFAHCEVISSGTNCTGLIGVNSGNVVNCKFNDIKITPSSANIDEVGIIAHQNGGHLTNIVLDNIKVYGYASDKKGIDYVGSLCGKITDGSVISNINGINIEVSGATLVGGLAGQIYITDISDVVLTNIIVNANGNYAGGLTGRLGTDSNGYNGSINNITIVGTPTYNASGEMIGSTTKISTTAGSYTGGVAGQSYHSSGENFATSDKRVSADGIVVEGYADAIGGIYGYNYSTVHHLEIRNSLVKTADTTVTTHKRVGGIVGYEEYGTHKYFIAENILIDSKNHSQVGGIIGYFNNGGLQYSYISESVIKANSKTIGTWQSVGGTIGQHNTGSQLYNGVFNTVINAESMDNVGGLTGQLGSSGTSNVSVQRSFNISDYDEEAYNHYGSGTTRYTAAAKSEYYIKGHNYVGGIVGSLKGGNIQYSYSNANVIAGNGQCAGGLTGYYGNEYASVTGGGKSYSNAQLFRNYFAGTVTAPNGYAGGAIGRTGLLAKGLGTDSTGAITGSGINGSRVYGVNGISNEKEKTYGNIIFADSITGATDKTRNFAADDKEYNFTGKNNTLWEGTKINGLYTTNILFNDNYAYNYWNPNNDSTTATPLTDANSTKLLMFKHSDLDGSQIAATGTYRARHNRASMYYRNIGWGLNYVNDSQKDYANRTFIWAMSIGNVCVTSSGTMKNATDISSGDIIRGLRDQYETSGYNTGTYLPQIRSATTTKYASDYSIKLQNMMPRLPLPKDDTCVRQTLNLLTSEAPVIETYGIIYSSDVDKLNVEFSDDLVGKGYFSIKIGDVEIYRGIITNKVYTFGYGYTEDVVFEYGVDLIPTEINTIAASKLVGSVMVYEDSYYYLSDNGIVYNDGIMSGDFINLMNGKALDTDGFVWNVSDWTIVRNGCAEALKDVAVPLWNFEYMGYSIETYAKHSIINTGTTKVVRNDQLFVTNGKLFTVDGSIKTTKTDVLIYNLNGTDYLTVLGLDGFMVDLFNSNCNVPESVDNKAIVNMSSTIDADIPYVVLEYSNGGILCYNYATGEIVFDNTIPENLNVFEYALDYFNGEEKSMYSSISSTYKANASIAANIKSTEELERLVALSTGEQSMADPGNTEPSIDETTEAETTTEVTTENTTETTTETTTENVTEVTTEDKTEESSEVIEEDGTNNVDSTKFMTLYNSNTGVYEIVNVSEYLSSESVVSENEKLGIKDFSKYENGFASSKTDIGDEKGIIFYIIPVLLIFVVAAGVEVYVSYRRNKNNQGA